MTVKELIDLLSEHSGDKQVVQWDGVDIEQVTEDDFGVYLQ